MTSLHLSEECVEAGRNVADGVDDTAFERIFLAMLPIYLRERREEIARALYADWVAEDFANEYAEWELLGDKETWLGRADAALSAISEGGSRA